MRWRVDDEHYAGTAKVVNPHASSYTVGEITALIAPVVGADADDLADWAIVTVRKDGGILTASSDEDIRIVIQLLAVAIGRIAGGERD
jgi:hypothetical protein